MPSFEEHGSEEDRMLEPIAIVGMCTISPLFDRIFHANSWQHAGFLAVSIHQARYGKH